MGADPATVAKLLLVHSHRIAVLGQPLGQPLFFPPHGIGVLAAFQPVAQDLLEGRAGNHRRRRFRVEVAVALVAGQQPLVPVEQDETVRNRLDRRPDPHLVGDVERERHDVAAPRATILQAEPGSVRQPHVQRLDRVGVPTGEHRCNPALGVQPAGIDQPSLDSMAQDRLVAGPGRSTCLVRGVEIGAVGHDQPQVGIEHREAVANDVD